MSEDRKEIKIIEGKLEKLSSKHVQLVKKNQFTFSRLLFSDPELDELNTQIADLKLQRSEYFKVLQAGTPEKDWSKKRFYLKFIGENSDLKSPIEQYALLGGFIGSGLIVSRNLHRYYHLVRAADCKDPDLRERHLYRGNLTEMQVTRASRFNHILLFKAFFLGLVPALSFLAYFDRHRKIFMASSSKLSSVPPEAKISGLLSAPASSSKSK